MATARTLEPPRQRRTQEERSAETRKRLLDAAIECLIELGYAATTTAVVAERAGVSRGAQLHHYPTKADLLAAAVDHLSTRLGHQLAVEADRLPQGGSRLSAVANTLLRGIRDPLFLAWVELRVAARTDPELRAALAPVEKRLRDGVDQMLRRLFGPAAANAKTYNDVVALSITFFEGLLLERAASTDSPRVRQQRETATIEAWKHLALGALQPQSENR
ncbi:MAG: TetR/AcrR family transcriptional regulator [Actinomycetota bacterium]|jgi:AcrR family transcriptional regulator